MKTIALGAKTAGGDQPPYFTAEIGANHNGDMSLARRLVEAAARCGADAVKFQSWSPASLVSRPQGDLARDLARYALTPDQHRELAELAAGLGAAFASSAFSRQEIDLLVSLGVPFLKIASMDIDNTPLLAYAGSQGLPVVLSTGMADLGEIEAALKALEPAEVILLHCVSLYPPRHEEINLRNMDLLRDAFGRPTGYSDHSLGPAACLAAAARGAVMIEKHFTLDKKAPGWDHAISADPDEFRTIVEQGRRIQACLGSRRRRLGQRELDQRRRMRRSLVAARALRRGEILSPEMLVLKRPGTGIPASEMERAVGRRLTRDLEEDSLLRWEDLQ